MRKAILRKIKSEKGATLSMALLLFMVCAVVGAVILAAATAAAGATNKKVDADLRYYKVTSAAQLLAKEISGSEVELQQKETETVTIAADGTETVAGTPTYDVLINEVAYNTYNTATNKSFLELCAESLLFNNVTNPLSEAGFNSSFSDNVENGDGDIIDASRCKFTMTLQDNTDPTNTDPTNTDPTILTIVYCDGYVKNDGTLQVEISSDEESVAEKYTTILVMRPDFTETQIEKVDSVPISTDTNGTVMQETREYSKNTMVSWYINSIEK